MKINLEIDCTPEEARRAMGLPDLTPVHERFVSTVMDTMQGGVRPEQVEALYQRWLPMSEASMSLWRKMIEATQGAGTSVG